MEEIKQRGRHFKLIARSSELAVTHTRVDHATLGSRFSACKKTVIGRFLSALAHIYIRPRLWISEMTRELADLGCQGTQTGDIHCIDMYLSCVGGGECKEVHVGAQLFAIY